ncbi:hypothetical protein IRP63_14420 (plasmid) [Clostridium botulinum]|uniref:Uncharacterized protein n=1 Tax=Clostridium botulinum C/D str. DC5 TaxID=1443128 RepID=A0A0A0HY38_CLOBO|nr:hypothetical protein [Clostridium botulinum]KGM93303.1 hypothetical protein Z955_15090 [Clostridium botulinum C/D str. DC5]KOC56826.1 hypothetical protein ADU89_01060 [Clostridium botulinum]KOC57301.1 hypothetical protein ADU90_05600 [Clostridium botulinum]MCD3232521.1 hypothetical protein [Clostridium botulinum D/C]MCD3238550.1 hypothetical protein [Clostridium botulinum D/C]
MENINIHNKNLEIICDMDDVLVNLSEFVVNQYNKDFDDNMNWQDNKSYWWGDCKKAYKSYFEQRLIKKGTFINPRPTENSIKTLNKLHEEGFKIIFCTYPQYDSDYCIKEKIQWLQQYFKWFSIDENLVFTHNKGLLAKSNRILLDDNLDHIFSFISNGGIGCIFNQSWNGNVGNRRFIGYRITRFEEFYTVVHNLENELIIKKHYETNVLKEISFHNKYYVK